VTDGNQDTTPFEFSFAWVLLSAGLIATIAVVLNAEGRQLGEAGRVLAGTAALALLGSAAWAYASWARRRRARRDLIEAWLRLAAAIGCWTPHATEDLGEVLRPLIDDGTVSREDAVEMIYWLEEVLYRTTSVPAEEAIAASKTLAIIREECVRRRIGA
jgi:hypothetical protein